MPRCNKYHSKASCAPSKSDLIIARSWLTPLKCTLKWAPIWARHSLLPLRLQAAERKPMFITLLYNIYALHTSFVSFNPQWNLWGWHCYWHFTEENTEAPEKLSSTVLDGGPGVVRLQSQSYCSHIMLPLEKGIKMQQAFRSSSSQACQSWGNLAEHIYSLTFWYIFICTDLCNKNRNKSS